MSLPQSLDSRIDYILKQSDEHRVYLATGAAAPVAGSRIRSPSMGPRFRVIEKPGSFELVSEPVILLKKLYASCTPEQQKNFCSALLAKLTAKNGVIVAHAIVELLDTAALRYWETIDEASVKLWCGIADKVAVEHWTFSDEALADVAAGTSNHLWFLREVLVLAILHVALVHKGLEV